MANKRITELPSILGADLADADLLTLVRVFEVDPTLKNKKLSLIEFNNYLQTKYLTLTGGTMTGPINGNLTISGTLIAQTVSGATVSGTTALFTTGVFQDLTAINQTFTNTGPITAAAFIPSGATVPINGLFRPSVNTIGLSSSGIERARIDSSGRVLVGTSTASGGNLLQVNSDILIQGITVGVGPGINASNSNTAVGVEALYNNDSGSENTANGSYALYSNTTGYSNTANGASALYSNTSGNYNTANGAAALLNNTTGNDNTANGVSALRANTTGGQNTANGYQALYSNTTGSENTANGTTALYSNTTGSYNTANGKDALGSNTTGSENTANGTFALYNNTSGNYNTANGYQALYSNTTGNYNTANGYQALYSNTTGNDNVANGINALYSNTSGNYNTANGASALFNNTTGSGNIGIGGLNASGTYAPVFDPTTENNRVVMGSTSVTNAYVQVAWTVVSDARDKTNFGVVPHGLEFVKQLSPVSFQFKETRESTTPNGPVRYGFKAQDILALEGEDNAVIIDNEDPDKLRYNGEALVPVLVNAIKEQQVLIDSLITRLDAAGV